jgi:hypothetical protein
VRVRLARLFWIGAAALLGAAALIAIAAVLRGDFTDTDGKLLAVLGTALVAGGVALGGLALVERRDVVAVGWTAVVGAVAAFVVLVVEILRDFDEAKPTICAALVLLSLLLVVTARLLTSGRVEAVFWVAAALVAAATAGSIAIVLTEARSETWAKPLATVWILAGLAWALVPVLAHLGRRERGPAAARERVVGHGPGHVEVELAEGEVLVVRHG